MNLGHGLCAVDFKMVGKDTNILLLNAVLVFGCMQRYGQSSLFKRTVLELIAEDLLALPQTEDSDGCQVDGDMKPVRTTSHRFYGLVPSSRKIFSDSQI